MTETSKPSGEAPKPAAPPPPRDPAPTAPVAWFDRGQKPMSQPPPTVEKK